MGPPHHGRKKVVKSGRLIGDEAAGAGDVEGAYDFLAGEFPRHGASPDVRVAVLTGRGAFYSAGNDLSNFTANMPAGGPASGMRRNSATT